MTVGKKATLLKVINNELLSQTYLYWYQQYFVAKVLLLVLTIVFTTCTTLGNVHPSVHPCFSLQLAMFLLTFTDFNINAFTEVLCAYINVHCNCICIWNTFVLSCL